MYIKSNHSLSIFILNFLLIMNLIKFLFIKLYFKPFDIFMFLKEVMW